MFIQSTTLVLTDLLGNQTDVLTADGIVPTTEEMIARLPVGSRPLPANHGLYQNRYNLRCCYEMRVLGETGDGLLVVEYDIWTDRASRDKGDPPALTNTHLFQLSSKPGAEAHWEASIRYHIEEFIRRASLHIHKAQQEGDTALLAKWIGDQRDHRIKPEAADARLRLRTDVADGRPYKHADVQKLHGEIVERL